MRCEDDGQEDDAADNKDDDHDEHDTVHAGDDAAILLDVVAKVWWDTLSFAVGARARFMVL